MWGEFQGENDLGQRDTSVSSGTLLDDLEFGSIGHVELAKVVSDSEGVFQGLTALFEQLL
jgi:hypothetical protein